MQFRAVFRLSKVNTWLRLLRLVIGLKDSRQFFKQGEAKPKPIAPCTHHFSRTLSELQVISRDFDWFIARFAPVVIGRSDCLGFGFRTFIWQPLYNELILIIYYDYMLKHQQSLLSRKVMYCTVVMTKTLSF